jgi:hypothetical protein
VRPGVVRRLAEMTFELGVARLHAGPGREHRREVPRHQLGEVPAHHVGAPGLELALGDELVDQVAGGDQMFHDVSESMLRSRAVPDKPREEAT